MSCLWPSPAPFVFSSSSLTLRQRCTACFPRSCVNQPRLALRVSAGLRRQVGNKGCGRAGAGRASSQTALRVPAACVLSNRPVLTLFPILPATSCGKLRQHIVEPCTKALHYFMCSGVFSPYLISTCDHLHKFFITAAAKFAPPPSLRGSNCKTQRRDVVSYTPIASFVGRGQPNEHREPRSTIGSLALLPPIDGRDMSRKSISIASQSSRSLAGNIAALPFEPFATPATAGQHVVPFINIVLPGQENLFFNNDNAAATAG